ncbi:MAG: carboxypeptidase-like regulatory domain-containing protein [Chitinophagaceae bacterium]|nr:carboxypeptidase-like regulatory domain-containing protein [Chitinophagaceae bacterium]
MNQNLPLSILCLVFFTTSSAQTHRLTGKITNSKMEPLAFASVSVKGTSLSMLSREDGTYEFLLDEGEYQVGVTMVGYHSQIITLVIHKATVQHFILEADEKSLDEVVVKGRWKDRSEEVIREVIKRKEALLTAAGDYSCVVYIKATQQDSTPPSRKKKQLPDSVRARSPGAAFQGMAMAEISLRYDQGSNGRYKEERMGVTRRGNPESLFYQSVSEGDFNLYRNLLQSRVLSEVPFVSPVSYSGLIAYRYKMQKIETINRRKVYTISYRPAALSNTAMTGELKVEDSTWAILEARFTLPSYHVAEYDRFEVIQQYNLVNNKAWLITRQEFNYFSAHGKGKLSGTTIASYQQFELNKQFAPRYFGPEVSATAQEAYERDSSFWNQTRTEPLTIKEVQFIRYKDSIQRVVTSKPYLDSIDRVTNTVTWKKILFAGQNFYFRPRERMWSLPSLVTLFQPLQPGGFRISPTVFYNRVPDSRKVITIFGNISYGFRNKDLNGSLNFYRLYNPFNRGYYTLKLNRDFDFIYSGDAWINMIKRNNIYLDNAVGVGHGLELWNGLYLHTSLDMALRRSISNYKTGSLIDSLFGEILDDNQAVAFDPYNALYGKIQIDYTPAQQYIREPREKIILGSHWPTFYMLWRKGIAGPFNSKVDFDYIENGIRQELKLGTAGISKYHFRTGTFLNRRDLRLVDYQFQRRGDPILFLNPQEAFQSLDSTFPVFKRFYQLNYLHEFNGSIVNKIPVLKKIQLREVAGGGFLYAPERNLRYAEVFAGVERVFKVPFYPLIKFKLGAYVVGSVANQFKNPVQFKIGIMTWDRKRNKWL